MNAAATAREWLSIPELAALLNVPEGTVRQWNARGTGPARYRIGRHCRFAREDVLAWIDAQRVA